MSDWEPLSLDTSMDGGSSSGSWLGGAGTWLGNNSSWLGPAVAMAGSTLYATNANNAAAKAATAGNAAAMNNLRYMYDTTRADLAPYRAAGNAALAEMVPQVTGGFKESPGYQFSFNEGMRALNNSSAARGLADSGAAAKAAIRYGNGVASTEYSNYWNRLAALAGIGQTSTGQGVNANQNYGNSTANIAQNNGTVAANNLTANGNAVMSGTNNLLRYFSAQG